MSDIKKGDYVRIKAERTKKRKDQNAIYRVTNVKNRMSDQLYSPGWTELAMVNIANESIEIPCGDAAHYEVVHLGSGSLTADAIAQMPEVKPPIFDSVNHPKHYNSHPSGLECITVTRHHNFNTGNAMKYLWRCGLKDGHTDIEDLKKAVWYLNDEIERLQNATSRENS